MSSATPPAPAAIEPVTTEAATAPPVDVDRVEVERDPDTRALDVVVYLGSPPPAGLSVAVDVGEGPQWESLVCVADVCVLTVPAEVTAGRPRLTLQLGIQEGDQKSTVGPLRTFNLDP